MDRSKNSGNYITGVILVVLGLVFLANQFDILNFGKVIGLLWPLLLIYLGVRSFMRRPGVNIGGIILLLLGLIFFVDNLEIFDFGMWNLWPLILVAVGIGMLFNSNRRSINTTSSESSSDDTFDDTIVFWGLDKKMLSRNFKSGKITAIFGGAAINMREAEVVDGAVIDITAIFGGVEIKAPKNVNIINKGSGILGSFTSSDAESNAEGPKLEIRGEAIFGGVEVK